MCGIAGILQRAGCPDGVDRDGLARTSEALRARGPDGHGQWIAGDERVGLAHRRLSIIDLSPAGAQPMHSADGRYAVVFNGEIYNYRELRDELRAEGAVFATASDTEVLLHLFARRGAAMVDALRGMFAFAVWDARKRRLFLARDPFGIKPLYYAPGATAFRFASQVRALLAGGDIDRDPEPAGHAGFFLLGSVPEPWTLFRGIRALPAGHTLWVSEDGPEEPVPYWTIAAAMADARHAEAQPLGEALRASVRRHHVADVPVGLFLSAGLDSSTLTALAAERGGESSRTVTMGFAEFEGTAADEVPLAERVAALYGTSHATRRVSAADFAAAREDVLAAMDQPSIDGVNTYFVSRAAAQAGLKVALSGVGADELFGGYPSFRQIPRLVRGLGLPGRVPGLGRAARWLARGAARRLGKPKAAGLLEYGGGYGGAYLLRRGLYMPWELPDVLEPDLARDGWRALQLLPRLDETISGLGAAEDKVSALELGWYMRNQLLRDSDWAGMAHSLEIRVPFVDVELFRAVLALRAAGESPSKQAMAATADPPLPDAVRRRPKSGFGIPVDRWIRGEAAAAPGEVGLRGWARAVHAAAWTGSAEPPA